MSIAMKSSLSPQHLKLVVVAAGLLVLMTVWDVVQAKVSGLRHQPVYGEQGPVVSEPVREELQALPIVMAKSEVSYQASSELSDAAIEAAFREPVIELPEESQDANKISLSQQLLNFYRPVVNAVSTNGAVINNQFWSIGESVVTMPLRTATGELVTPKIHSVSEKHLVMVIGDETVSLDFDRN
jgi:hypothetical protein